MRDGRMKRDVAAARMACMERAHRAVQVAHALSQVGHQGQMPLEMTPFPLARGLVPEVV